AGILDEDDDLQALPPDLAHRADFLAAIGEKHLVPDLDPGERHGRLLYAPIMPRWQRVYLSACAGIVAFALGYALTDYAHIPRLYYLPTERSFRLAARLPGLAIGYYGLILWGALAGVVAAAATWALAGRARRPVSE